MHFKKLFAPHILDRGYYYFIDNAVTGLKDKDGIITAKVEGTTMYDGTDVIDMECGCPYVEGWNNCKHMATVPPWFFCIVLYYSEYLLWQIKKVIHCISHLSILYQDTFTHHFQTRLLSLLWRDASHTICFYLQLNYEL